MRKNQEFNLADMRGDYAVNGIDLSQMAALPMDQFDTWFEEARAIHVLEPNAMVLATCDANGIPSARTITIKHYDEHGMIFFSDHRSQKGSEIQHNTAVSGVFWWPGCDRQIRISGHVDGLPQADTARYFAMRPRFAQAMSVAFAQGTPLSNRDELLNKINKLTNNHGVGSEYECPDYWNGYRITPNNMEFMQLHKDYLHYRINYLKQENGSWEISYLSP